MTEHPARHIDVFFTPIIFSGNAETILHFSLTSVGELRGPRLHLCLIKQQRFCWYEIQVNADVIKISLLYLLNTYIFKVYHEIKKNYTTSVVAGTSLKPCFCASPSALFGTFHSFGSSATWENCPLYHYRRKTSQCLILSLPSRRANVFMLSMFMFENEPPWLQWNTSLRAHGRR